MEDNLQSFLLVVHICQLPDSTSLSYPLEEKDQVTNQHANLVVPVISSLPILC